MSRIDTPDNSIQALSMEMAAARSTVESTVVTLRSKLQILENHISEIKLEIETKGIEVDLRIAGRFHEAGSEIDSLVRQLKEQKQLLDQAIHFARLVQKT